ncbi:flavin-containing superfamily amine oxidase-like protein [Thermoascus aurantiacus ATCC 26904]
MGPHWKRLLLAGLGCLHAGTAAAADWNSATETVIRDVCIIGGGASGTYAAVRLRDAGKTVAVVEKEAVLGGHTNTYNFFTRLGVRFKKAASLTRPGAKLVDFRTGQQLANFTLPDPTAALAAYGAQLAKFPKLEEGFFLPDPGLGDILRQATLYVFKNFGLGSLQGLQTGFLDTVSQDNHEIYDRALDALGPCNVFLSSRVLATDRSCAPDHVRVLIQTPAGNKIIQAKKLLVAIPQKPENLAGFDLDATEQALFSSFRNSAYYTALVRGTGLPPNTTVTNLTADTPFHLPPLPGIYRITRPRPFELPVATVKAHIISSIRRLVASGIPTATPEPEIVAFNSHTPFELTVPVEIRSRFYRDLYALQGRRNTFYTGAAFHTHLSALLWQFTERVVQQMLA